MQKLYPRCPKDHDLMGCWKSEIKDSATDIIQFLAESWICVECKRTYDKSELIPGPIDAPLVPVLTEIRT